MYISPQLLEKVFVRGSLQNTETGFEFKLKNIVDSGTIGSVKGFKLDGADLPLESVSFRSAYGLRAATEITYQNPLPLNYGTEATVMIAGTTLEPGEHQLVLTLSVIEAGKIELAFKSEIA